jgi:hypothetical protein
MIVFRLPPVRLARWLVVPVCLWGFGGCASLPPRQIPETVVSAEFGRALLHEWLAASGRHAALQGVAKLRVQAAQRNISATQVLLVEKPQRLRAETLSPFGTPLLVLTVDGDALSVLLPGDNLFYRGRATPETLGRFTRLALHPVDLVNILLAQPPVLTPERLTATAFPAGGWRLDLDAGTRRQQLVFDSDRRLREVRYLQDDDLQLRLGYGVDGTDPAALPPRIDLELPLQQTRASLVFEDLAADRPAPPGAFTLTPPAGATVVSLDDGSAADVQVPSQVDDQAPAQPEGGR